MPIIIRKLIKPIFYQSLKIRSFTQVIPDFDVLYLTNKKNLSEIENNIKIRKGIGNIQLAQKISQQLQEENLHEADKTKLEAMLQCELRKIPNKTHPDVINYVEAKEICKVNLQRKFDFPLKSFHDITKYFNNIRMDHLGNFTGHKSYYLMSELADLKQALINYTVDYLLKNKFQLMSVPDILPENIIESCGMATTGERTQVYRIESSNLCLSGTSEMALAGFFAGKIIDEKELPIRLAAVSRCFRAETSGLKEEKGIYRVHQFTKVEMFSVCKPEQSANILEEFKNIEIELFKNLGLHFKVLDMPPYELGAPAYRKYDIEAFLPSNSVWGEISSCSDCTDYQSRRLNIRIKNETDSIRHAHTINGTACAVPRMLIAILENFQNSDSSVTMPTILQKYLKFKKMTKNKHIPELKLIKNIPREKFSSD